MTAGLGRISGALCVAAWLFSSAARGAEDAGDAGAGVSALNSTPVPAAKTDAASADKTEEKPAAESTAPVSGERGKQPWELTAESLLKDRKIFEAIQYLHDQIRQHPDKPRIRLALIRLLREGGKPELAGEIAKRAANACPKDIACQILGGLAYQHSGNDAKAEACFQKAVTLKPGIPDPYRLLISFYAARQRHTESVRYAVKALERFPDDYDVLKVVTGAFYGAGQFKRAEKLRKKVANRRAELIKKGRTDLRYDEFVFHVFPADEYGHEVRVYDNFSGDKPDTEPAALWTFRVYDTDSRPLRAIILNRAIRDGKANYQLIEYRMANNTSTVIKAFGDQRPTYMLCLTLVMDSFRKSPLGGDRTPALSGNPVNHK